MKRILLACCLILTAALTFAQTPAEWEKVHVFYCPGGLSYEKMPVPSKLMMKVFAKTMQAKKDKTEGEAVMARMIAASYDISDRKYIEPILACLAE